MTCVAIHQPNYLPWLGFFDKLFRSDVFVILDDAQFQKTGGNWVNRTRILRAGQPSWLTIPVRRPSGIQRILDVCESYPGWRSSHQRAILETYRTSVKGDEIEQITDELFSFKGSSIAEFNLNAIEVVVRAIGRNDHRKIIRSSTLEISSSGTQRLVDIVLKVDGDKYLCGDGSAEYLENELFDRNDIELEFQKFHEYRRPHLGSTGFVPGLTVIDAIAFFGCANVPGIIKH